MEKGSCRGRVERSAEQGLGQYPAVWEVGRSDIWARRIWNEHRDWGLCSQLLRHWGESRVFPGVDRIHPILPSDPGSQKSEARLCAPAQLTSLPCLTCPQLKWGIGTKRVSSSPYNEAPTPSVIIYGGIWELLRFIWGQESGTIYLLVEERLLSHAHPNVRTCETQEDNSHQKLALPILDLGSGLQSSKE